MEKAAEKTGDDACAPHSLQNTTAFVYFCATK
jgi:hypothetical protein